MRTNWRRLAVVFIAIAALAACKKKKNNSTAGYKLGTIDITHVSSISHYRIVYDVYNNVDSMVVVGGGTDTGHTDRVTFNYFGSSYTINNGTRIVTINANTNGTMLGIDIPPDTIAMSYYSNQLGKVTTQYPSATYPYYTKIDTSYLWNNGDIVCISFQSGADSIDYDASKSGQIGDALHIDHFLSYGKAYLKPAHVPTQLKHNGAWLEKYYYTYDGGRISSFIKVKNSNGVGNNDTTTYVYQYYAN